MRIQPQKPKNIIFTGVAGTGKTYRLQQIAKQYTDILAPSNKKQILNVLVSDLSWQQVICLIFLDYKRYGRELLKVSDIVSHKFFRAKAIINKREDHLNETAWSTLQKYSSFDSATVKYKNKASQSYFDKDETSNWYLLEDSLPLLNELAILFDDYLNNAEVQVLKKERFAFVSFHQAYGYDEFVEGIRPDIDENTGYMRYKINSGVFLELCQLAIDDPKNRYAILIDEINRANVAQVFGELMTLIEPSKRLGQPDEISVRLAYSKTQFGVPSNVDIYATMNTQDYSLVSLDSAFRRRFEFIEMKPDGSNLGIVKDINDESIDLSKLLDGINFRICQYLGNQYQLGQAYFYSVNNINDLLQVMVNQVLPQLIEYTTHHSNILNDLLLLEKTHWLVTNIDANNYSDSYSTSHFSKSENNSSYQINPELKQLIAINNRDIQSIPEIGSDVVSDFLQRDTFERLYR